MLEKVRERGIKDPLLFHKIGFIVGGLGGFLVGLFISDRASEFEVQQEETEETIDGETEPSIGQATEQ